MAHIMRVPHEVKVTIEMDPKRYGTHSQCAGHSCRMLLDDLEARFGAGKGTVGVVTEATARYKRPCLRVVVQPLPQGAKTRMQCLAHALRELADFVEPLDDPEATNE